MKFAARCMLLAGLASSTLAQTFSDCNPLNRTDCPEAPALGGNATFLFNTSRADTSVWDETAGQVDYTVHAGEFTINGEGDSVTISTQYYLFFGRVSIIAKPAMGQGIVSSIVLESADLDEVDIEWIGGNNTHWQSNYFGKGNTTSYDRAVWHPIDDPQNVWYNYTIDWTKERIEWWVNDDLLRTLKYEDANGGENFPQTPMNLKLGIWSGGDPKKNNQGTIEWAGGETNFHDAPFTMYIQEVYTEDYTTGSKSYKYGDKTGSWQSIIVNNGTSKAEKELNAPHGTAEHWAALPKWARAVIPIAAVSVFAVGLAVFIFCCIKQRRAGHKAYALANEEWNKEQEELLEYKSQYNARVKSGEYAPGGRL